MADWGNDTTYQIRLSSDPSPTTGWTTITRAQATAAEAIPQRYRKGMWPASVVEMTQPEKDVVDAADDAARADDIMSEVLDLVNGHIRAQRIRDNNLRDLIDQILSAVVAGSWPGTRSNLQAITAPSQVTPTANRTFIRGKVEDIQEGTPE